MANTEVFDLQALTVVKYNEIQPRTSASAVTGTSWIDSNNLQENRHMVKAVGRNLGVGLWDQKRAMYIVKYCPEPSRILGASSTDAVWKRITRIPTSPAAAMGIGGMFLLQANVAWVGGTINIGLIINSTVVANNANPLRLPTGTTGFAHLEIWLPTHNSTVLNTRGLALAYGGKGHQDCPVMAASPAGRVAVMPNASLTSITFTVTAGASVVATISNVEIWNMRRARSEGT